MRVLQWPRLAGPLVALLLIAGGSAWGLAAPPQAVVALGTLHGYQPVPPLIARAGTAKMVWATYFFGLQTISLRMPQATTSSVFWFLSQPEWDVDAEGVVVLPAPFDVEDYKRCALHYAPRRVWPHFAETVRFARERLDVTSELSDLTLDDLVWPMFVLRPHREDEAPVDQRAWLVGARCVSAAAVSLVEPDAIVLLALDAESNTLKLSSCSRKDSTRDSWAPPPGRWAVRDSLRWASNQAFSALPSGNRWWFLTADNKLWSTPRQGEPNREITQAWAADERKVLATIIDHDLNRSFVYGDGWYLDLGDELKEAKEPGDKPWPRPDAKASEIDKLLVYRGWVDLGARAKQE